MNGINPKVTIISTLLISAFVLGLAKLQISNAQTTTTSGDLSNYLVSLGDLPMQKDFTVYGEIKEASTWLEPKLPLWQWMVRGFYRENTNTTGAPTQNNARKYILVPDSSKDTAHSWGKDAKYVYFLSNDGFGTNLDIKFDATKENLAVVKGRLAYGTLFESPGYVKVIFPDQIVYGPLSTNQSFIDSMSVLYGLK